MKVEVEAPQTPQTPKAPREVGHLPVASDLTTRQPILVSVAALDAASNQEELPLAGSTPTHQAVLRNPSV